ncbi:MAG TPA: PLD nuclease N-terminal domain-containing protein [Ktedonobacteraceae bacterium]
MSGNRGCIFNTVLFLVIVFVPILGHIIATIMLLEDDHSAAGTVLWLALIWLVPFLGCFLFLMFGQRRRRVMFGQPSYNPYQYQQR